jgi:putative thioredoxin
MIFDVAEQDFQREVVERSRQLPVIVDFWAAWCGPCRALTPALENAARAREGKVDLAKVDVDANQSLAASFGIRGIPAVKAFRDGRVADEFTGALPPPQVEAFFDRFVPSKADEIARAGDEPSLRHALELDPRHVAAARELGRLLLRRGDAAQAQAVLAPFENDYVAAGLEARARLTAANGRPDGEARPERSDLESAFEAWDAGDQAAALEALQRAVAAAPPEERDLVRRVMVAIFTELGPSHELSREHRRRLAAALN